MLIQDLNHLEVVSEESNIEGGLAIANAGAYSSAIGSNFAATSTNSSTSVYSGSSGYYWYYYYPTSSSNSSSSSSAAAA